MSEQNSLSLQSIGSSSTECSKSDIVNLALSEEIPTESLGSHIQRFESGIESLSWTRLMEWFVEAAIGAELFRNEHPSAPPLSFENIRIDSSSTIVIAFPSSPDEPSISGSLSSDISTLCSFFLRIHRKLEHQNRLDIPLDPAHQDLVFARLMVALIEYLVASGDLIFLNSSPADHSQYFAECYHKLDRTDDLYVDRFLLHNLPISFYYFVLHSDRIHHSIPADHSFLRGDDIQYSDQLLEAVKKIKETHSLEIVRNAFNDWTEWVRMMEAIAKDATLVNALSFLQSRCLRATLLSLQTKHQHIVNPTQTEEHNKVDHPPFRTTGDPSTFSSTISTFTRILSDNSPLDNDTSSTTISTQTSLPSDHWSSNFQTVPPDQLVFHTDFLGRHSKKILSVIHLLLTRPRQSSFPWDSRPSFMSESDRDAHYQPFPRFIDENEKFDISLFDKTDDVKVVASLHRCLEVVQATKSAECIVNIDTFRTFLISGLHSSNFILQMQCHCLFSELGRFQPTVDDPRDSQFHGLREAFIDGTFWEKITLLHLWWTWLLTSDGDRPGQMMVESDFEFAAFLATDLSDTKLFDFACHFVDCLFLSQAVSMTLRWKLDFLLSFEKRHQMMSRLTNDQNPYSQQKRSDLFLSPLAITFGSLLSVFRGCDFTSALTEHITNISDPIPPHISVIVNAAFFLNHTSIDPKHRHSFVPMDLLFERFLRDEPEAFLISFTDMDLCAPRKFLFTPNVGLHSLLLRCPELNLNQLTLMCLMNLFTLVVRPDQATTRSDIGTLFGYYPPPRLLDTLLSSPHFVRADSAIWIGFLIVFSDYSNQTAPFGACSSLAKVFKMLSPFNQNPTQYELDLMWKAGEIVVSLHWFNIPAHFDSPLLCHLPSLAGAQRGVLQTLSSHSGIPSLAIPLTRRTFANQIDYFDSHSGVRNPLWFINPQPA
ncbi:hypothetical protein BLNAU_9606 [Blattamonas nauphoetae]|uniref:Uncharacterized protein n=1 Tax=Blattamonas nauphoetae TaxID=2049346 RepID=A0ABQ9XV71_9EUKA|nr:hypothetical protein BLNAU_9606 [Blattamonas nauphoetae]